MSPHKKHGLEDTMDEDSDDKDTKRKSRNLSEKKRRDQFNLLVNELSALVSTGSKKLDKSSVLRATISFLKNHNEISMRSKINEIQEDWKPSFLTNEEFTHLVLEAVDGFIIVFSSSGQIHYTSESITSLLGYLPKHIVKMTIYELAIEEDQSILYNMISHPAENKSQVAFSCHLKRSSHDEKQESCDLVHFVGYFRSDDDMTKTKSHQSSVEQRLVFVGTGRIQTPLLIKDMPLVDSNKSEFISRHSLEWKFLFLDHRAPPIIGYLPFEVLGTSGYEYYHIDDLDKVISCHESLMQKGEGTSCYYRFLTKGQQWIWLQTRFYITYHQWNSKPEFVVCTHRVISYVDVMKETHSDDFSTTWQEGRGVKRAFADSECSSMTADSPASKKSEARSDQYLEAPQFVAVPLLSSYPRVVSPVGVSHKSRLPQDVIPQGQNQIHVDLQRKQAELQAIIGQQQQELRRVSEQLLMARLGMYQQPSVQPVSSTTSSVCRNTSPLLSVPVAPVMAHPSSMIYCNLNQHDESERN